MARPLKTRMQMLDSLGPLSSGGIIAGTGGTPGQAFTGEKSGTDFVNADSLIEANKGKGASMTDAALSGQIDETADFSDLNDLNKYDPAAGLSTSTAPSTFTNRDVERTDEKGNVWKDSFKDTTTGPTTTTYSGWSDSDLNAKAEKIRGLSSQFQDFGKALGDTPEGADRRASLLNDKNKKSVSTYSAGQNAFDSFLGENEGQPAIQNKADKVKALAAKFDGLDTTVGNVRQGIQAATGKVGVVDGKTTSEGVGTSMIRSAPVAPTTVSMPTDGLVDVLNSAYNQDPSKISIKDIKKNISITPVVDATNKIVDQVIVKPVEAVVGGVKSAGNAVGGAIKKAKKWKL